MCEDKAAYFALLLELIPGVDAKSVIHAKFKRPAINIGLYLIEQKRDVIGDALERSLFLRKIIAPRNFDRSVLEIAHADAEPNRNAL